MPPTAYFDDAVVRCRAHPKLAAGIHLTLMAVVPMRPLLPPDQVPSLVAPDGFFYRGGEDFIKARPKIAEVEKALCARIRKCLATGLRFWCDRLAYGLRGRQKPARHRRFVSAAGRKSIACSTRRIPTAGTAVRSSCRRRWKAGRPSVCPTARWCVGPCQDAAGSSHGFLAVAGKARAGYLVHSSVTPGFSTAAGRVVGVDLRERSQGDRPHRGIRLISFADLWKRKYSK